MIKVVIIDDSLFFQSIFTEVIEKSGKVKVVGKAGNGREALAIIPKLNPDLIVLDCEMPVMGGIECLRRLKKTCSIPVFMLSALTHEGAEITIEALEIGAEDFFPKPVGGTAGFAKVADTLIARFEALVHKEDKEGFSRDPSPLVSLLPEYARDIEVIAIGSSTGGVRAMKEILPNLSTGLPPIVWAQHMPLGFTASLAKRLNDASEINIREAIGGEILESGYCYLAPGGFQMRLQHKHNNTTLDVFKGDGTEAFRPCCDILFFSVAECFGANALGVILTGMGKDGAKGLEIMHREGAVVIGQSEQSCSVYGMPKAAFELGAVDLEMDIKEMAGWIKEVRKH